MGYKFITHSNVITSIFDHKFRNNISFSFVKRCFIRVFEWVLIYTSYKKFLSI